ncbi:MAG: HEPN domain-containing protein [bacterium]
MDKPEEAGERWKQALEAYGDARFNADHERWSTAVDRAYYAVFYGVLCCLALEDEITKTHRGASTLFGEYFVKTGKVEKGVVGKFNKLMENRIEAGYAVQSSFTGEEVKEILRESREVLVTLHEFLDTCLEDLDPPPEP